MQIQLLPQSERAQAPAVTGRVYDLDGAGVPDAEITATSFEVAGNLPSVVGSTRSGEDGRFELRLPAGAYEIHANKEGYGPNYVPAHSGDQISLVLPGSGVVEGRVLDEHGDPIGEFAIDVLSLTPDGGPATAPMWSKRFESADGSFRATQLPSWSVVIRASAANRAPAFSERIAVKPGDTKALELRLPDGCTLEGIVVDEQDVPAPGVFIDAESRLVAGSMSEVSMAAAKQAESGIDGRFHLQHVPLGEVLVRGYDGVSAVSTVALQIDRCDTIEPVRLVMSAGGGIAGVVRRSDGTPQPGATVTAANRAIGVVTAVSDGGGRYRFEQIQPGYVRMEVGHDGKHLVVDVGVTRGEITTQDVTLPPVGTGELRGQITARGRPLPGFRLQVVTIRGAKQGMEIVYPITADDGTYHVPSLAEGRYAVSAISSGKARGVILREGEVATLDIDVAGPREQLSARH